MAEKGNKTLGCFTLIVILISLATIMSMCSSDDPEADKDKSGTAWAMSQLFVEEQLKSPSTAKYPWDYDPYVADLGDGKYEVNSYVDSENSFGTIFVNKE